MLETIKYKNHINEVVDFGKNGIYVNMSDIRDYAWNVTTKNNMIASLDYGISTRKLPIVINCATEEEGIAARNRLFEVTEKDVLAKQHGQLIVGGYYFRCFVTKSEKQNHLYNKQIMTLTLTLTSDYPYWVKETTRSFGSSEIDLLPPNFSMGDTGDTGADLGINLDYSYDYPIDYTRDITSDSVNNANFTASNFRLIIYGSCINPAVYIAGHLYQVDCSVGVNEYLTIDSSTKKIYLTANDGTVTNVFGLRNRDSYIFEKIPVGACDVSWSGEFGFDIILLEERSEPKWT